MGAPQTAGPEEDDGMPMKKPQGETTSLSAYLSLVQQYLSVFLLDNAIFLAERCVADYPTSPDAVYMLALCYHRNGSPQRARQLLDSHARPTPVMRYLSAVCSEALGDYTRAEEALLKECRQTFLNLQRGTEMTTMPMDDWIVQTTPCPVPNGAAGLALLGKICRKSNRKDRAIQYFKMSISLDPFLWTSFETLAELGVDYSPSTAFGVEPTSENIAATAAATPLQPVASTPAPGMGQSFASSVAPSVLRNRSVHFVETPGLTPISSANNSMLPMGGTETPISKALATPQNPVVLRRAKDIAGRHYYPPSPETPLTHMTRSMRYLKGLGSTSSMDDVTGARSLFLATENKASNQASVATASVPPLAVSSTTKAAEDGEKPEKVPAENKVDGILELLAVMGGAYQRICRYQSRAALQLLGSLPPRQQITGWVLHQQGRAFLEMNDFTAAQRSLELMQVKDPGRMQGLELLSTVYWQLKKEVSLANLSQRVVDMDRLSPQAWCVVGNCFSLQKDHESALVFFKRSLQLDNDFTYSHTLSGYEYMANEDFDKAIACFRQALRVDERHYNAWYGLGAIYHRQEKFDVAEHHFEKAVAINSGSSVLRCNLGIAQHANGKSYQALDTLHGAFQLDPKNPQARFQRATIYSALQRPEEALVELEKVRDAAPREATIHFAMGKVLKRLGRLEEAMKCFLTAMDLDPKDNQMIKSAMDKLDEPDADEEAMAAF